MLVAPAPVCSHRKEGNHALFRMSRMNYGLSTRGHHGGHRLT